MPPRGVKKGSKRARQYEHPRNRAALAALGPDRFGQVVRQAGGGPSAQAP